MCDYNGFRQLINTVDAADSWLWLCAVPLGNITAFPSYSIIHVFALSLPFFFFLLFFRAWTFSLRLPCIWLIAVVEKSAKKCSIKPNTKLLICTLKTIMMVWYWLANVCFAICWNENERKNLKWQPNFFIAFFIIPNETQIFASFLLYDGKNMDI